MNKFSIFFKCSSPPQPEGVLKNHNKTAESYGIKYQMPGDLTKVYSQFGIDVAKHNEDDSWTLPLPARLIIDPDGIIRDAEFSADYTVRPEPEDTLEKLRKLVDQIH